MNAIKKVRKYLVANPKSDDSQILSRLVAALGDDVPYKLSDLYKLEYDAFALAIALLEDWRLDRYYAARMKLFDATQVRQMAEGTDTSGN
jgi:hypothetical protein